MKNFFLSLKTTVWTLLALICIFFAGSYLMPAHKDVHGAMNDRLLFEWVEQFALDHPGETSWFFLSVAGLIVLTINTIVCSFQAIKGRWSRQDFLLRIAPQIVHIGFLFILLAHLIGAGWGYRLSGVVPEGSFANLPGGQSLILNKISVQADATGYLRDWEAEVYLYENSQRVAGGILGPNQPLFYRGVGIYLKSLEFEPTPAAFLLATKDPGAVWALVGAILFIIGTGIILVLKWKKA
jgi:hypothetical protein